jgi:phage FluMu gp28-like protein
VSTETNLDLFAPGEHRESGAPYIYLPYQQQWIGDRSEVKFCEKSRRIGITWAQAADDVLVASTEGKKGMDVLYIGYNQEMTREYVDTCADWSRNFNKICGDIEEFFFEDDDPDKQIRAYRISFASGHEIVALSSRPTNLRGRQGRVVIDEAAFHDNLQGLMKAALALLIWGGQVVVISTHFGEDNAFNEYCQDIRADKAEYSLHRYDFDRALAEGLYQRICLVRGVEWTAEGEAAWRDKVIKSYGDDADEELFCVPSKGTGAWLTTNLIENCMDPSIPVIRWEPPARDFVDWPERQRVREVEDWCREHLEPRLLGLSGSHRYYFGQDFGRRMDLSVFWPLERLDNLDLWSLFVLELRQAPFETQKQILFYIVDRLPLFAGGALDATGNGMYLAEVARQRYSERLIHEVMLSEPWYREHMPKMKAQHEDRSIWIPKDADIKDDLRLVKLIKGVAKLPEIRSTDQRGEKRHGDAAVAEALAIYAAKVIDSGPIAYGGSDPETVRRLSEQLQDPGRQEDEPQGRFFNRPEVSMRRLIRREF